MAKQKVEQLPAFANGKERNKVSKDGVSDILEERVVYVVVYGCYLKVVESQIGVHVSYEGLEVSHLASLFCFDTQVLILLEFNLMVVVDDFGRLTDGHRAVSLSGKVAQVELLELFYLEYIDSETIQLALFSAVNLIS